MSGYRLSEGGRINRSRPVSFSYNGKTYQGYQGDTLASALLANGVNIVGRSFKYHRPRGIMAAGLDEPNAILQVGGGAHTIPDLKATGVELYDGLSARCSYAWPSVDFDLLAPVSLLARFMPAGFYYKTMIWPNWHVFEPAIRKAVGLGTHPKGSDPDTYDKRYVECDVLVVGGGPAGLAAAKAASRSGARVIVAELDSLWGGSLNNREMTIDGKPGLEWADSVVSELEAAEETTLLNRTMAFGYYDHNLVGLVEKLTDHQPLAERKGPRQRLWKVRAEQVILATGAIERPLVFPNNDRPGVMLASAVETYVNRYGAAPGKRVLIATNNDSAYEVALSLKAAGLDVVAIADARVEPQGEAVEKARKIGLSVLPGHTVTNVKGRKGVRGAELHAIDDNGSAIPGNRHMIDCDLVITSGGWSPAVHLFSQSGGKLRFDEEIQAFVPNASRQSEVSVGAAVGEFILSSALRSAAESGVKAAAACGFDTDMPQLPEADNTPLGDIRPLWQVDVSTLNRKGAMAWLDFQNDVKASDVKLAVRESFKSVEHVKRYTTLGMASDQGKTSNVNAIGVMGAAQGKQMADVGTTTFRPPYDPVTIGAFAGRRVGENLMPLKPLAAEMSHKKLGGLFDDLGRWNRPLCYPRAGESANDAMIREVKTVRNGVGLFDASPLGKIEVYGPDAGAFLNMMYANNVKTLKPGQCRYGLMLNENGSVFDDGVCARLSENHFLVGTTSGHAGMIVGMFREWLKCELIHMNVVTEDVTTDWAVVNINGPKSRDVLAKFDSDIDFSREAFPHMHFREGVLEGVPCRVQRVSFSGELSYEISVPWQYGASLWDAMMTAGEAFDIAPVGADTINTLRLEKGFLHVGADTDGSTQPQDIGFGGAIAKKQDDFAGRRSTMRPDSVRDDRRQLVGLEVIDSHDPLMAGAHIIDEGATPPTKSRGWVTSSALSPTLNKPVALAQIEGGNSRMGEEVVVFDMGTTRRARIVQSCSYDVKGERLYV